MFYLTLFSCQPYEIWVCKFGSGKAGWEQKRKRELTLAECQLQNSKGVFRFLLSCTAESNTEIKNILSCKNIDLNCWLTLTLPETSQYSSSGFWMSHGEGVYRSDTEPDLGNGPIFLPHKGDHEHLLKIHTWRCNIPGAPQPGVYAHSFLPSLSPMLVLSLSNLDLS